jgi:hypothetical protein
MAMTGENMNKDLDALIEESITLELNIRDVYLLFHKCFPADAEFWFVLAQEENNHAALIRSGKEYFVPANKFPYRLLDGNLQNLKDANADLRSRIKHLETRSWSREEAFMLALKIENSSGELHFQQFVDTETDSTIDKIFKQLNKEDKAHAQRIQAYMKKHGIAPSDNP